MSQEPHQDKDRKDAATEETLRAGKSREGGGGTTDAGDPGTKVGRGVDDEKASS